MRPKADPRHSETRAALLDAAMGVIRTQGYSGTTVDDICQAAGVTKGSFFHYFGSKEDLALAAAEHFAEMAEGLFRQAPYHAWTDPKARVLGYVGFRKDLLQGELPNITCLLGTMVQETYATHPRIREACETFITAHAATLEADLRAAKALYAPKANWDVKGLALHTQAVLQGAFILAKATGHTDVAMESVGHLQNYLNMLLPNPSA